MARIEGEIIIGRPAEAVFDFAADQRNEPRCNQRMTHADEVSDGPVGRGTVFRSASKSMGRAAEMRIELAGYDRPGRLASRTASKLADIGGAQVRPGAWRDPDALVMECTSQRCGQAAGAGDHLDRPPPGASDVGGYEAAPGNPATSAMTAGWPSRRANS